MKTSRNIGRSFVCCVTPGHRPESCNSINPVKTDDPNDADDSEGGCKGDVEEKQGKAASSQTEGAIVCPDDLQALGKNMEDDAKSVGRETAAFALNDPGNMHKKHKQRDPQE